MYEIFEKLLKEHNVTPYQVYKATGVAQSSLSDWKNGKSKPKYEKMKKIADYFGVTIEYLLGNETPAEVPPNFPARLRYLREQKGETQEQLAENMDVSQNYLACIECGRQNMSLAKVLELSQALGINIENLLRFS